MYAIRGETAGPRKDRRLALKHATDAAHQRVEAVVQDAGMFASRKGYLQYLRATYAMRARFEGQLDASGAAEVWPDWAGRRIAGLAAQDLVDLGGYATPPEFSQEQLPPAELLGVLYVLEGSALGARILVTSVQQLGLTADFGARHLHAQAGDRGAWRSFLSLLEQSDAGPCHDAANRTFAAFETAYREAAGR